MFFPKDLWENIFTYFHSAYRLPNHYVAMMKLNSFKKRVKLLKQLYKSGQILVATSNQHCIFNSFYISILLKQIFYDNTSENYRLLPNTKPDITLNINTTKLKIKEDFLEIINEYLKNGFWNPRGTTNLFQNLLFIKSL